MINTPSGNKDGVKKVGIAGHGAIGSAVAQALVDGIEGYILHAVADLDPPDYPGVAHADFAALAETCDLIIEALPPAQVPELSRPVFKHGRDLILISSCAALLYPDILAQKKASNGRIIVPSGSLCGLDGVRALAQSGIKEARIRSTKPPHGFQGAPYIDKENIDLESIKEPTLLFSGNAYEAAQAFPANVNVAATLSLAGIGPEKTRVEIWADPKAPGNSHEIDVKGAHSHITAKVQNITDPNNPKTSKLAAQSIISILKSLSEPIIVL